MQGDSKPNNVLNNQIIVGDHLGMPEDAQHRITFADFRKQAREFNYHNGLRTSEKEKIFNS